MAIDLMAAPAVKQVKRIVPGGHKPVAVPASPFPKASNTPKAMTNKGWPKGAATGMGG